MADTAMEEAPPNETTVPHATTSPNPPADAIVQEPQPDQSTAPPMMSQQAPADTVTAEEQSNPSTAPPATPSQHVPADAVMEEAHPTSAAPPVTTSHHAPVDSTTVEAHQVESAAPSTTTSQQVPADATMEEAQPSSSTVHPPPPPATTSQNVPAITLESDSDRSSTNTASDTDSALGSMHSSRTRSVTSSVAEFRFENGRRYHSYDSSSAIYAIPNDENEQDRLELQHHIWRVALDGRHYFAPIPKERIYDILDLGCGTGAWCIEVADEHPQAQVLGVDLSPIQPDLVPPNCSFLVDDCNADWIFAQKFDIIHTRAMTLGIKDWAKHARQAYAHLKPGGFIELQEICMPFKCTEATSPSALCKWTVELMTAGEKLGGNYAGPSMLTTYLEAAGFVNITVRWQHWPVGPWAKGSKNKLIGRMFAADLLDGIPATTTMFTRILGWEKEAVEEFSARVTSEIQQGTKKHVWAEVCIAYGQKPEEQ